MSNERPTELKLVFDEPVQKKKAPKHLADFAPADRKAFAKELGGVLNYQSVLEHAY